MDFGYIMQWMRAEFEIPADKGYVLGDLFVREIPLEFGGQLAGLFSLPRGISALLNTYPNKTSSASLSSAVQVTLVAIIKPNLYLVSVQHPPPHSRWPSTAEPVSTSIGRESQEICAQFNMQCISTPMTSLQFLIVSSLKCSLASFKLNAYFGWMKEKLLSDSAT
jgi:hypothetical protein